MKKDNLLIITPVRHIEGFVDEAKKNFKLSVLENPSMNELKKKIKYAKYVFTNPNMSKLPCEELLKMQVEVICTASTGTVHIDEKFCKKKDKKFVVKKKIKSY